MSLTPQIRTPTPMPSPRATFHNNISNSAPAGLMRPRTIKTHQRKSRRYTSRVVQPKLFVESIPTKVLTSLTTLEISRQEIIHELIQTERNYIDDMKITINIFLTPIKEKQLLSKSQIASIFSNLESLIPVNESILKQIEDRRKANSNVVMEIGDLFLDEISMFKLYAVYCGNQHRVPSLLNGLIKDAPDFKVFLDECAKLTICRGFRLESFLIQPLQRLCKYPLLFESLLRKTPEDHVDRQNMEDVYKQIKKVVTLVNERARQAEYVQQLTEIQKRFDTDEIDIVQLKRFFVIEKQVILLVKGGKVAKDFRNDLMIFNDLVIITRQRKTTMLLQVVQQAPIESVLLQDLPESIENEERYAFEIMFGSEKYTVIVPNSKTKKALIKQFCKHRMIICEDDGFIPVKAKKVKPVVEKVSSSTTSRRKDSTALPKPAALGGGPVKVGGSTVRENATRGRRESIAHMIALTSGGKDKKKTSETMKARINLLTQLLDEEIQCTTRLRQLFADTVQQRSATEKQLRTAEQRIAELEATVAMLEEKKEDSKANMHIKKMVEKVKERRSREIIIRNRNPKVKNVEAKSKSLRASQTFGAKIVATPLLLGGSRASLRKSAVITPDDIKKEQEKAEAEEKANKFKLPSEIKREQAEKRKSKLLQSPLRISVTNEESQAVMKENQEKPNIVISSAQEDTKASEEAIAITTNTETVAQISEAQPNAKNADKVECTETTTEAESTNQSDLCEAPLDQPKTETKPDAVETEMTSEAKIEINSAKEVEVETAIKPDIEINAEAKIEIDSSVEAETKTTLETETADLDTSETKPESSSATVEIQTKTNQIDENVKVETQQATAEIVESALPKENEQEEQIFVTEKEQLETSTNDAKQIIEIVDKADGGEANDTTQSITVKQEMSSEDVVAQGTNVEGINVDNEQHQSLSDSSNSSPPKNNSQLSVAQGKLEEEESSSTFDVDNVDNIDDNEDYEDSDEASEIDADEIIGVQAEQIANLEENLADMKQKRKLLTEQVASLKTKLEIAEVEKDQNKQYRHAVAAIRDKIGELVQENEDLISEKIKLQKLMVEMQIDIKKHGSTNGFRLVKKKILAFQPTTVKPNTSKSAVMEKISFFEKITKSATPTMPRKASFRRGQSVKQIRSEPIYDIDQRVIGRGESVKHFHSFAKSQNAITRSTKSVGATTPR